MGGASVELREVSLGVEGPHGPFEILRGASLSIRAGELVCLLGPSGSGKSTILNLIAGLATPTSGTLLQSGRPLEGAEPGNRAVVLPGELLLFPWLSLRGNVEFPLRLQGIGRSSRAARSEELLRSWAHLWRSRESSIPTNSRGECANAAPLREPSLPTPPFC